MKIRFFRSLFPLLALFVLMSAPAHAAATLTKVLMTTGSLSEREGVLYVAQDQGFFRKYGLDLTLVQVRNGPVGMSALASGEFFVALGIGIRGESGRHCRRGGSGFCRRLHQ